MGVATWHKKIARAIRADPRKAGVLAVLIAVMGLMWFKALTVDGGPSRAKAAFAPSPLQAAASDKFVPTPTPAPARPARRIDEWIRTPVTPMTRNLFSINLDYFPVDESKSVSPAGPADPIQDQLAKSIKAQADLKTEREQKVEELRQKAAQLHLESTMTRPTPKAMVDGQMVVVDDTVDGFRVVRITARGIVVERDGIKLEISFK